MESPVTFGEELIARRKQLGLSQSAAARKAGVDRMTWRAWEKGQSQPLDFNHVRIEHALGWEAGSVELAITKQRKPVAAPRRTDIDPLRDATEQEMWNFGISEKIPEWRIWEHIDNRRERLAREAEEEAARRGRNRDSA